MKSPVMGIENSPEKPILAVDIGGTKLAVALVSQAGEILSQIQEPTSQDGPQHNIAQIVRLMETLINTRGLEPHDILGIGIGIPAMLESGTDFIIWGPNLNGWRNVALRPAIEAHFGLPVCVEYDGHTAVLGEWWVGAGHGYHSLVDIIIGTGLGGGMILEDHLVRGVNRLAGAAGWFTFCIGAGQDNPIDRSLGYWEARTAGPGIARRAQELLASGQYPGSVLEKCSHPITSVDVFVAAQHEDLLAKTVCNEIADLLGSGIANIISLVNPEIIILGGSVGANAGFLIPRILEVANTWAQPISVRNVQIITSALAGKAGLLGAAYGALLQFGNNF
jgi:glucokinase